jgi:hypothetical protein
MDANQNDLIGIHASPCCFGGMAPPSPLRNLPIHWILQGSAHHGAALTTRESGLPSTRNTAPQSASTALWMQHALPERSKKSFTPAGRPTSPHPKPSLARQRPSANLPRPRLGNPVLDGTTSCSVSLPYRIRVIYCSHRGWTPRCISCSGGNAPAATTPKGHAGVSFMLPARWLTSTPPSRLL